ncbi:DUF2461 domain-containing protein [Pontibacter sp. CAU 1760]
MSTNPDNRAILSSLRRLQANNAKAWMDAHREEYQQVKANFAATVQILLDALQQFDPSLQDVPVAACMFRINKNDFSGKGAAVYKGHLGAGISAGGRHSPFANYVLVLEPNNKSRIGGGIRKPGPRQLELIREEIDYSPGELSRILMQPDFAETFGSLQGEKLKGAPKGYDKAHPEIDLLRQKGFQVLHYFTDEEVCSPDFIPRILLLYKRVKPLHDFLNRSLTAL